MIFINVIIGLPGSGKTTYAQKWLHVVEKVSPGICVLFDDLSLDFSDIAKRFNPETHRSILITDPKMCGVSEEHIIKKLDSLFNVDVRTYVFFYFENDPEACIINALRDPKPGGTINFIKMYSPHYKIPPNAIPLKVYREKAIPY